MKNSKVAGENALEFVYLGFINDFLTEISDNSLRSGLAAKSRAALPVTSPKTRLSPCA